MKKRKEEMSRCMMPRIAIAKATDRRKNLHRICAGEIAREKMFDVRKNGMPALV